MLINEIASRVCQKAAPPPSLTISQWADIERRLSSEASSEPGAWRTSRTPYLREIMDSVCNRDIHTVVVMSSAQVGKTEVLLNIIGYYVHYDPSPILMIQPSLDLAEAVSKDRIAPMIRDTPALKSRFAETKSRDSGSTLLHKKFLGGHLSLAGANSPSGLSSRPIRIVLFDEVDRYPPSAGTEGDPVALAKKRTATFWNRKTVMVSTPTIKGFSRIESAYLESDQRRYFVKCPHCLHPHALEWDNIKYDTADVVMICPSCGNEICESEKPAMLRNGEWVSGSEINGVAGFHLNELYSPWRSWKDVVSDYNVMKSDPERYKAWVNTSLGIPYEEPGEQLDSDHLIARAERYHAEVPDGVVCLTAGVDLQQDRLEIEIVGWGAGEESWSIDYQVIVGDPVQDDVWADLFDIWQSSRWSRADGTSLGLSAMCVDSGFLPKRVYKFVANARADHVYPVKGRAGAYPVIEQKTARDRRRAKRKKAGAAPELIGVDEAKSIIIGRLRMIHTHGPGYCHFPVDRDREWYDQITAEKLVTRYQRGARPAREWIKTRPRNEALDCRVYAYAALLLSGAVLTAGTADQPTAPRRVQLPRRVGQRR